MHDLFAGQARRQRLPAGLPSAMSSYLDAGFRLLAAVAEASAALSASSKRELCFFSSSSEALAPSTKNLGAKKSELFLQDRGAACDKGKFFLQTDDQSLKRWYLRRQRGDFPSHDVRKSSRTTMVEVNGFLKEKEKSFKKLSDTPAFGARSRNQFPSEENQTAVR